MTSLAQRQTLLSLIDEAVAAGARAARACQIVGLSLRTVQRWKLTPHRGDQRPERIVSDDNPYSEALFRTLKYRPQCPRKPFASLQQARAWVARFVHWYNREHRHSAIRFITPEQRHMGLDTVLLAQRQAVYEAARARASHRWSGPLRHWSRIDVAHLNPDKNSAEASSAENNLRRAA